MIKNAFESIERHARNINLGITAAEFALFAEENDFSEDTIRDICVLLEH